MDVNVVLDLDDLKKRLCADCRLVMEKYLKELAIAELLEETKKADE